MVCGLVDRGSEEGDRRDVVEEEGDRHGVVGQVVEGEKGDPRKAQWMEVVGCR